MRKIFIAFAEVKVRLNSFPEKPVTAIRHNQSVNPGI